MAPGESRQGERGQIPPNKLVRVNYKGEHFPLPLPMCGGKGVYNMQAQDPPHIPGMGGTDTHLPELGAQQWLVCRGYKEGMVWVTGGQQFTGFTATTGVRIGEGDRTSKILAQPKWESYPFATYRGVG